MRISDWSSDVCSSDLKNPEQNWTGLFAPGERIRLRFINAAAMTYFDVRIPGLEMTVVQADGNNVQPVKVDEFRIAVAETYDVIVRPMEDQAYSIIRSEEHTSELQSLMRISYAVFCLKKKNTSY